MGKIIHLHSYYLNISFDIVKMDTCYITYVFLCVMLHTKDKNRQSLRVHFSFDLLMS